MSGLSDQWQELCERYCSNTSLIRGHWHEIASAYRGKGRHYHNLGHIEDLLSQARQYQDQLEDYDMVRFSIFYHDIIYSALRKDNERRSSRLAQLRLGQIGLAQSQITRCLELIKATEKHRILEGSTVPDLPFFLDFDLCILGSDWEKYLRYTQQIRKEYRIYPAWMYRKGRRKVLSHFLEREQLFFTPPYYEKFESQARQNLQRELELLKS